VTLPTACHSRAIIHGTDAAALPVGMARTGEPGKGTTFFIRIPVAPAPVQAECA
jgi:hypothetical protein